ncbi:MAG: hypothetical protein IT181_03865, partial [Acidobacteria bacterium]|nr:hypothetical protein [Acidobacteriota bacterium]
MRWNATFLDLRRVAACFVAMCSLTGAVTPAGAQTPVTYTANPGTLGAIADSPTHTVAGVPRDVTFTVTGFPGRVAHVRIEAQVTHPFLADLGAELVAPDGTT